MKIFVIIAACFVGVSLANQTIQGEVCYEHYGCFPDTAPWTARPLRPESALPQPPYETGTRFILFTRGSHETEQIGYELMPDKDAILRFSDFQASRKTYFLIHGFTDNHKTDWIWNIKNSLLQNEDANIISIDWISGAKAPYLQATANARLVGAMIARMITYLEQKAELDVSNLHMIAHSLGAHVAGYAGYRLIGRIAQITAIDPTDLYFGGTDPVVRLDTSDARFVEVIHSDTASTNGLGLGIPGAIGHVDYYPNGGTKQPGCEDTLNKLVRNIQDLVKKSFDGPISAYACSHARGAHLYAESFLSSTTDVCGFNSYHCNSYADFEKGNCYQHCAGAEAGTCALFGYQSKNNPQAWGEYYLRTSDGVNNRSFCKHVMQLQIPVSLSQQQTTGYLTVTFRGDDGSLSDTFTLADNVRINPGQILTLWVDVPHYFLRNQDTEKPSLTLRYTRGGLLPPTQPNTLALDSVTYVVVKPDFTSATTTYRGVTLNAGTDTVISN